MKQMKKRLAFFDTKPYDKASFEKTPGIEKYDIVYFETKLTERSVGLTKGFDAGCAFVNDELNKTVIDGLHSNGVKFIAMRCAGYNNIDTCHAYGKLRIARVPAYSPYAVAEHALALMMTLNRKTHTAHIRTRDNNFSIVGLVGMDMKGKTAGVIGAGKIGRVMAGILAALGMRVLVYDKYEDQDWAASIGATYTTLDELYAASDIITLHCPLTDDSFHMINGDSIELMKPTVMLINTSRGALIDTKALIKALKKRRIGAAGLDVYEEESDYFFEDKSADIIDDDVLARLLTFNNVLVTSHQAFLTNEALENISETTVHNLDLFFSGKENPNEICARCDEGTCDKHLKVKPLR